MDRFDRNIRFFGEAGQRRVKKLHAAVVGCGGNGEHVIQQLAFSGLGEMTLIEDEELDRSNRNRYVLSRETDPIPGSHKVEIAARAIADIDSSIVTGNPTAS